MKHPHPHSPPHRQSHETSLPPLRRSLGAGTAASESSVRKSASPPARLPCLFPAPVSASTKPC